MTRAVLMLLLLLSAAGCFSDGEKHWYDEALKDARGDNMKMRSWKSPTD